MVASYWQASRMVGCILQNHRIKVRERVFTLREYGQSIPHLEKLLEILFSCEILFIFVSIYTSPSLIQGQESIFTLEECTQSILCIELPLKGSFLKAEVSQLGLCPIMLVYRLKIFVSVFRIVRIREKLVS
jgi:hypothetical protein